jgi:protein phosphatase
MSGVMPGVPIFDKVSQIATVTHNGARNKPNEDRFDAFLAAGANGQPAQFLVVADGVTSTHGGERASDIAIRVIKQSLSVFSPRSVRERMHEAILRANQEILETARQDPELKGMSTTVVLAAIDQGQLSVVHLGDSRAYLIRGGKIHQITRDHTWVQEAIDEGRITAEQARTHPNRHVIMRYLGDVRPLSVDFSINDPERPAPDVDATESSAPQAAGPASLAIKPGDRLLLCSDGYYNSMPDPEMKNFVLAHPAEPDKALERTLALALKRKEPDNITAILWVAPGGAMVAAAAPGGRRPMGLILAAVAALVLAAAVYLLWQSSSSGPPSVVATQESAPAAAAAPVTAPETDPPATVSMAAIGTATEEVTEEMTVTVTGEGNGDPLPTVTGTPVSAEGAVTPATDPLAIATATTIASATATLVPSTATPLASTEPTQGEVTASLPGAGDPATKTVVLTDTANVLLETENAVNSQLDEAANSISEAGNSILPTASPTSRASAQPGPTALATSTPLPRASATPTPTTTPTRTATPRPPAGTPTEASGPTNTTSQGTSSAATSGGPTSVTLLSPTDGHAGNGIVTFSWQPNQTLALDQVFEPVYWKANETYINGRSWKPASEDTSSTLNLENLPPENYKWGVWLGIFENGAFRRLRFLEAERTFSVTGVSSGGNDSGGGGSDESGDNENAKP